MPELTLAIPSKGRLKEQTEAYFSDCGLKLRQTGGDRGYTASLDGAPGVNVLLLSASEIARGVLDGSFHLGVTGEDLLREHAASFDDQAWLLKALGFGFARMVVAVPESWIDVETIADLEDVGHAFRARTGRRMRVATKYLRACRRFFAERGLTQYRLVDSAGATEAAPASGSAELIVDITTTGSTLRANNLKILSDGEILASQAQLSASLNAAWTPETLKSLKMILDLIEARQHAKGSSLIVSHKNLTPVASRFAPEGQLVGDQLMLPRKMAKSAAIQLAEEGFAPVSIQNPEFLFLDTNPVFAEFSAALNANAQKSGIGRS